MDKAAYDSAPAIKHLLRWFSSAATLTRDEIAFITTLASNSKKAVKAGEQFQSDGEKCRRPQILASGWACRSRTLSDGRRQILEVLVPGDTLNLQPGHPLDLFELTAISDALLLDGTALAHALECRDERLPNVVRACEAAAEDREAPLLNHVFRLGSLSAVERICHWLIEIHARLKRVGLAEGLSFSTPLVQNDLGNFLGLSLVHVNRCLQRLRQDGLISWRGSAVSLLKYDQLAAIAQLRGPISFGSSEAAQQLLKPVVSQSSNVNRSLLGFSEPSAFRQKLEDLSVKEPVSQPDA